MSWVTNADGSTEWVNDGQQTNYGNTNAPPLDPNSVPASGATQVGQQGPYQASSTGGGPIPAGAAQSPTAPNGPNASVGTQQGETGGGTGAGTLPSGANAPNYGGDLQGLWNQYRQTFPQFRPTQGSATSLQPFVDWANAMGANIKIAPASSGGFVKGILDPNGQFIKLLSGNDQPTWLPGGDANSGESGGLGGGIDPSYLSPFTKPFIVPSDALLPQVPNAPAFNYPDFKPPSIQDILANDPGYQFRLDQGAKTIASSAAAKGLLNSGGTLADILGYGQNMASQEADAAFNRSFNVYGANRANAADIYKTNYSTQFTDPFQMGTTRANDIYGRAQQEFGNEKDIFYQNQSNPFNKLYSLSSLGLNAASQ